MVVGLCTLFLDVPLSHSLKDKRQAIKPVIAHLRNNFNVSVAEVDDLEVWQRATLAVACVSGDSGYAHGLLMKVVHAVDRLRSDTGLVDYRIEFL